MSESLGCFILGVESFDLGINLCEIEFIFPFVDFEQAGASRDKANRPSIYPMSKLRGLQPERLHPSFCPAAPCQIRETEGTAATALAGITLTGVAFSCFSVAACGGLATLPDAMKRAMAINMGGRMSAFFKMLISRLFMLSSDEI
ncbi:hypothetical protein [uncultured Cohaesibacter sp.]|uniref:hypothetical protein n=1 Tax=uncultured Cohaesibacter sp. TaxID=1002546 RepID=UPI00292CFCD8|nr:hypothetical protein [uncultured Cohaesibacter sp.]